MNFDAIIDALPKLTSEERARVARYLEHLRRFDDPQFLEELGTRIEGAKAGGGAAEEQLKAARHPQAA